MPLPVTHPGITVAVDGSPASKLAVNWAARDAAMRRTPLRLVHALPVDMTIQGGSLPTDYLSWQEDKGRDVLADALRIVEESATAHPVDVTSELVTGPPVPTLVDLSNGAQMIVAGSRGLGPLNRLLLGSVSSGLLHHAHCPVAIIRGGDDHPPMPRSSQAPVVVGIDGSPASESAIAIAFDEASFRGVGLIALHACSDVTALQSEVPDWPAVRSELAELLSERLSGWQERYPDVSVSRTVVFNRPAPELIEQSESAQLVVVGSRGRGGFTGMLLGSVSAAVTQAALAPVIVARPS